MYKKIMVPLDGSAMAECVLDHVATIGKGCGAETICLVRVEEPMDPPAGAKIRISEKELKQMEADKLSAARDYLDQLAARLNFDWAKVEVDVITGRTADKLADYARGHAIDLIIIATHGRSGVSRWVWGNTADRILRSSCTPVLMVRGPGCFPDIER